MGAHAGPPAVAPAVMVGPGPVPFPVMLGVDPGVMKIQKTFSFFFLFPKFSKYV